MGTQIIVGSGLAKQSVASQNIASFGATGNQAEAIVGGKGWVMRLHGNCVGDLSGRQIMNDNSRLLESSPMLFGKT